MRGGRRGTTASISPSRRERWREEAFTPSPFKRNLPLRPPPFPPFPPTDHPVIASSLLLCSFGEKRVWEGSWRRKTDGFFLQKEERKKEEREHFCKLSESLYCNQVGKGGRKAAAGDSSSSTFLFQPLLPLFSPFHYFSPPSPSENGGGDRGKGPKLPLRWEENERTKLRRPFPKNFIAFSKQLQRVWEIRSQKPRHGWGRCMLPKMPSFPVPFSLRHPTTAPPRPCLVLAASQLFVRRERRRPSKTISTAVKTPPSPLPLPPSASFSCLR